MVEVINNNDVSFNAEIIADAWESFGDGIPAVAAAAIINEFYDYTVTANDGIESDRDVMFKDVDVMVEEKAMGVCAQDVAEQHAASYISLDREDGKVLALNGAAVYENHHIPAAV